MQNLESDLELQLGKALEDAIINGRFHPLISPTIQKLLECLMVAKIVWRAPEFATKRDTQWLCRRAKAILHELLSLDGPRKVSRSTFAGLHAECLRLTLMIVMKSVNYRILHLLRKTLAARLRVALSELVSTTGARVSEYGQPVDTEMDRKSNEVLLWMLFIGFWAAGEGPDALWFAEAMVDIAMRKLGLKTFHDLEEVMLRHLYSRTAQQGSLMDVAAMVSGEILTYRVPNATGGEEHLGTTAD